MRFCRFQFNGQPEYGVVESVAGRDEITHLLAYQPGMTGRLETLATKAISPVRFDEASLMAPVQPSKIVCVGRNYRAHAAELGNEVPREPLLFFKPPSSLLDPGGKIRRPKVSQRTDYEGELGVIISRTCYKLSADEDVRPYILGYTVVNDFTARDIQKSDSQWTRGKGFDTFCPAGPMVANDIDPWAGVDVITKVNGNVRQHGNTRDFIFPLDVIIRYIADVMTLVSGDVIATGTPEGVGPVVAGDLVEITVPGIGTLGNPIVDE
jgi:2-keto-4-pentenoate hydratase/2-oxohepta-3-ene-1,7-dioic acid hydratase in catechol pathway